MCTFYNSASQFKEILFVRYKSSFFFTENIQVTITAYIIDPISWFRLANRCCWFLHSLIIFSEILYKSKIQNFEKIFWFILYGSYHMFLTYGPYHMDNANLRIVWTFRELVGSTQTDASGVGGPWITDNYRSIITYLLSAALISDEKNNCLSRFILSLQKTGLAWLF